MGRSLAACLLALLCAAPAAAQDRLLQIGWLWELAGTELTRLRLMSEVPWNAVLVAGSRYVLAPVRLNGETAALGYLDIEAGTRGLVPGVSLEWPGNAYYSGSPALAADPWRPRVFIWHGARIIEMSASSGLREVITNLGPLPPFAERSLEYSAAADVLVFVLPGQTQSDVNEVVIARADTGEELRRIPIGGRVLNLAADHRSSRVFITWSPEILSSTVQMLDLPDGALSTLPYASKPWAFGPDIDDTNGRLLFTEDGRVTATDDTGVVLGKLTTGTRRQITSVTGVSAASGRTFVQSYFGGGTYITPGPCLLHVVERTGQALAPIDLSARVGRQDGRCDRGILLTPPGSPGVPVATINGRHVALSWTHPGNIEAFELEVRIGVAAIVWPVGADATTTFADVPPGTYGVRVRGRNAVGVGSWSALTAITVP